MNDEPPVNESRWITARRLAAGAATLLVAGGLTAARVSQGDDPSSSQSPETTVGEIATVELGDLVSDFEFTGRVGYGDSWALPLASGGVVTRSRPAGTVVGFGEWLVWIDEVSLFLAEGDIPMYRDLELTNPRMTGDDVAQLQRLLIDLGFDDGGRLVAHGEFDTSTKRAVKEWQESRGAVETGRVDRSELMFSAVPLRIDSEARIGAAFDQLRVTGADPVVTVETNSRDRVGLPVGHPAVIGLADGSTLDGTVANQERLTREDGASIWRTEIDVDSQPPADATDVQVKTLIVTVENALTVPVSSLLAVAEGGFAVEMATDHRLVRVEVIDVIGGLAAVIGEIAVGDEVVIGT